MKKIALITLIQLFILSVVIAEHKELKAFPQAEEGMERLVIELPHKERGEEDSFKVELIPGKEMLTDGINQVRMGLSLKAVNLKGWGYTYYEVEGKPMMMSTLIGVPAGTKKVKRFVSGKPTLIRYNSRLPIVIYVPKGTEVRYRIWEAPQKLDKVNKG